MDNFDQFANKLIENIKINKNILLFVHIHPDCDAIGSALAFKYFVELNFKNKDVRIAGINKLDKSYLPSFFQKQYKDVDDQFLKKYMCVIFDTANYDRIYQKQLFNRNNSFRIDHHLYVEKICQFELIDPDASSTCELITKLIKNSNYKINENVANALYFGFLTDTIRFLTNNTSATTYELMSFLTKQNLLNKKLVHDDLYLRSIKDQKLDIKLSKYIKLKNGFGYLLFKKKITKRYGHNLLKSKLYLMSNIKEIKIYALLYYDEVAKNYRCSLRSRDFNVNEVAKKFSGGGHIYASGCKINNLNEFKLLQKEINKLINNEK